MFNTPVLIESDGVSGTYEWNQKYRCKHIKIVSISGEVCGGLHDKAVEMVNRLKHIDCPVSEARTERYKKRLYLF